MKKVNICLGRFQPFTAGHYKCVEAAWKEKHLPTVICMINVSAAKVDKRHPFHSEMLVEAYNDLFSSDPKIMEVIPVRSADIVTIGKTLAEDGYEIGSWTCGTDRIDDYTRMSDKYGERAGLADDFEMIEVPRTDEDISATKARTCLLNDDRDAFYSLMPQGSASSLDSLFDTLKEQINMVYYNNIESRICRLEKLLKVESLNADAEELMDSLAREFGRVAMNLDQDGDSEFYGFWLEYRGIGFWIVVDLNTNKVKIIREAECNPEVAVDLGMCDDEDDAEYAVWKNLISLASSEHKPITTMTKQDVRPMLATYYNSLLAVAKYQGLTADDLVDLFRGF